MLEESYLMHIGIKRRSGRYEWGSGEDPYQHEPGFLGRSRELASKGLTQTEIARALGMTTTQYRAQKSIALAEERQANISMAYRLKKKGYSNVAIAQRMNTNESTVRNWLDPSLKVRTDVAQTIATNLKDTIGEKGCVDIGKSTELYLNSSADKLKVAAEMLKNEGYHVGHLYVKQLGASGPDNTTDIKVLLAPGTTVKDIWDNPSLFKSIANPLDEKHPEGQGSKFQRPISVDPKRVKIRYNEEGGIEKDGVMEIRPSAADLRMGNMLYAQVRINVGDKSYLKGMAVYGQEKDFPKGVDIIFNTNKHRVDPKTGKTNEIDDVLKPLKKVKNPDGSQGDIDWDIPFGATFKNYHYIDKDGNQKQSAINLVNGEGVWSEWKSVLPSQMLSKQDKSLAKKQLDIDYQVRKSQYDDIMSLTNPIVKAKMLKEFADECDTAAVDLKAAAMPRQATKVILPITSLKDNEIYAPHLRDGEDVVLIRFPHGGKFEIPELKVNNKNAEAKRVMGTHPSDAVGINSHVAEILSGADFDGDNVLVIPNPRHEIKTRAPLAGLKNFDPKEAYPAYEGMKVMTKKQKGTEMGKVSNLITDMTLKGAEWSEIERAVRHSMVVIDAEKHKLNWRQSEIDNGIDALKAKYQPKPGGGKPGGASTLISRAKSETDVPERRLWKASEGGPIDPNTGELRYKNTNRSYVKKKYDKDGNIISEKTIPYLTKTTKMAYAKDAYSLSTGTQMENIYADYANKMKALANQTRKSYLSAGSFKYDPAAKQKYATEVQSLNAKLNIAEKNSPLERRAQFVANQLYKIKLDEHPEYDNSDKKRLKGQCLTEARQRTGAKKQQIDITDKEWEAIQNHAVSANTLSRILANSDPDKLKQLAMPHTETGMSASMLSMAETLLKRGYTQSQVAERLGISTSTLYRNLEPKKAGTSDDKD